MKKLLITSAIIISTLSTIGGATAAEDKTMGSYTGWAFEALSGGGR